jgi:hypothetical protein
METTMRDKQFWRSRWSLPLRLLALGAAMFGAFAIGDKPGDGVFAFGVMAALAAVFLFGGRSETLRGLGPGRDERWAAIDLKASAFAGLVLITAVIGAFLYEIANGDDGSPYAALGAISGVAYLVGAAVLHRRS